MRKLRFQAGGRPCSGPQKSLSRRSSNRPHPFVASSASPVRAYSKSTRFSRPFGWWSTRKILQQAHVLIDASVLNFSNWSRLFKKSFWKCLVRSRVLAAEGIRTYSEMVLHSIQKLENTCFFKLVKDVISVSCERPVCPGFGEGHLLRDHQGSVICTDMFFGVAKASPFFTYC